MSLFFNRSADLIEVIIRDYTGRLIEKFKCPISDKEGCKIILRKLKDKYGFEPAAKDSWVKVG